MEEKKGKSVAKMVGVGGLMIEQGGVGNPRIQRPIAKEKPEKLQLVFGRSGVERVGN